MEDEYPVQRGHGIRHLGCTEYPDCLNFVAHKGWSDFHCGECTPHVEANSEPHDGLIMEVTSMGTRVCSACGAEKDIELFDKNHTCAGGREPRCRECKKEKRPSLRKVERERDLPGSEAGSRASEPLQKPPLGIMPEKLWEEGRMVDLARAISEYAKEGRFDGIVLSWGEELVRRLRDRSLQQE